MNDRETHRAAVSTAGAPLRARGRGPDEPAPGARALVISQGSPGGIGLDLLLELAAAGVLGAADRLVADPATVRARAAALTDRGLAWAAPGWAALEPAIITAAQAAGTAGTVGTVAPASPTRALAAAVDLVLAEPHTRALVTLPIDKAECRAEGFEFPGHTEYLQARAGVPEVAMMLASRRAPVMRVVLATIHVPLAEVPRLLAADPARIVRRGALLAAGLRDLGIARPRIAVLGLNPHAGEQGLLGDDEARVIEPALAQWRAAEGDDAEISPPLPADTAFFAHAQGRWDGVLAMYHDQGLGPFKLVHFHDGVNVTLGLPFIRTSPDHGTARDHVGRGTADATSLREAIAWARASAAAEVAA